MRNLLVRSAVCAVLAWVAAAHGAVVIPPADGDLDTSYAAGSAFPGEGFLKNPNASVNQVAQILLNENHSMLLAGVGFNSGNSVVGMVANIDPSGIPVQGNFCHNAALSCTFTPGYGMANAFVLGIGAIAPRDLLVAGDHTMPSATNDFGFQLVDPTFDQTTPAITAAHNYPAGLSGNLAMAAAAMQSDGKFVFASAYLVNSNRFIIVTRALANLGIDTTFGTNGEVVIQPKSFQIGVNYSYDPNAIAIAPDGKIVVVATLSPDTSAVPTFAGVFRLNSDGSFDATFGPNHDGRVAFDFANGAIAQQESSANAVALRDDGSILVGGSFTANGDQDAALARLHADGSRGDTFGAKNTPTYSDNSLAIINGSTVIFHYVQTGPTPGDTINAISIQPNGRILVAGLATSSSTAAQLFGIARFERNGDPDLTFGNIAGVPGEATRYYSYLCGEGPTTGPGRRCNTPHDLARAITSDSAGIYVAGYSKNDDGDTGFSYIRLGNRDSIFANDFGLLPPGG